MANRLPLSREQVYDLKKDYGTPIYIYSESILRAQAESALKFPTKNGLIVRFALKSCPNAAIIQIFDRAGLHFDASSGYEIHRAIRAGISPHKLSLSSQEFPADFVELHPMGQSCGIRFNPGVGSGGTEKTNVGGPSSSFGIWHEQIDDVKAIATTYSLTIKKIHTHIGSGSDPIIWKRAASLSLALIEQFPTAASLNLGGGFKVARVDPEVSTDLQVVGGYIKELIEEFEERTGRSLQFEIEPGTYLTANAGILMCSVQDIVSTGSGGHTFIKLDSGMTEILRPMLYGAIHPIDVVSCSKESSEDRQDYVVVGHCCESGDLVTCRPGESSLLQSISLSRVEIDDVLLIGGSGAYCSSMCAKNYNSFPEAAEVLIDTQSRSHLIRRRQTLDQIVQNEVEYNAGAIS